MLSQKASDAALVNFVSALLDEGVLQPSDWTGTLATSLEVGLDRWVNITLGAQKLRLYSVDMRYCMNHETTDYFRYMVDRNDKASPSDIIGAFYLSHDPYSPLPSSCVGPKVMDLERLHTGLGFHVLALADSAAQSICRSISPHWAWWEVQEQWDMWGLYEWSEEDLAESGHLTIDQFEAIVPNGAYNTGKYNPRVIAKALNSKNWSADQGGILVRAQEVARCFNKVDKLPPDHPWCKHYLQVDGWPVVPMCIHWQHEHDPVVRVGDDHLESLSTGDEVTDAVFISDFIVNRPESIRLAVQRMKHCIELMVRLDDLLYHLDTPRQSDDILSTNSHLPNDPIQVAIRDNAFDAATTVVTPDIRERVRVRV